MSGRVVACWIPDWPVAAAAAAIGAAADQDAVAVVRRDEVVACSAPARTAGVRRRMRLRTALARCPDLRVSERNLESEVRAFEPVVRHLEQSVMPRLEVIRPGLIVAPARGPARYWRGEAELMERLIDAVAEQGYPAQCGIAATVFTAALAARTGQIVPVDGDAAWLAPFPVGVLGMVRHTELLLRLGITTVGQFAALPTDKVAARFGPEGQMAHRSAQGLEARPLSVRPTGADHSVARDFDPPEVRLEPLGFTARTMAEDLHQRLVAATSVEDARLLRVLKISEELGEVAEALHGALGANPRKGPSHDWGDVAKELADVIVTAMVALDTMSGGGAAVVERQLQNHVANEPAAAGDTRLLQVLAINGDMGGIAVAVYGALGTGPHGEAAEVTHTWEDVEARLGPLTLTAAAAPTDLTGDAWDTVDERLRFLVAKVRHRPGMNLSWPAPPSVRAGRPRGRGGGPPGQTNQGGAPP
ncbi:hypothetical protein ACFWY6_41340, partial [Streptomyces sp. NPDC059037]